MKNKNLLMISTLVLSATVPLLTVISCASGEQNTNQSELVINPDSDDLKPDPNSINFNVSDYQTKLATFVAQSEGEWFLPDDARILLNKVIQKIQGTEKIQYQLPTERFQEVPITLTNKTDRSKTKTISFAEFLEMLKVSIYKGDWSVEFSSKPTYGFNLLDGVFAKVGLVPASEARNSIFEFNNYIVQPEVAEQNPLFTVKTNGNYKLVKAEVKTRLDDNGLAQIEKEYESWLYKYKSTESIKTNTKADQINLENKRIEENNKNPYATTKPLIPAIAKVVPEDIVIPQELLDKYNKRKKDMIEERSKLSLDVTQFVAFRNGKVFLEKVNSDGKAIQSSWYDFLLKFPNSDKRRQVSVTDYLKISLNVEGGNSRTEKVLEVPFKSVTQFHNLIKIVKNKEYQPFLKFKIKKEGQKEYTEVEDWSGKLHYKKYSVETKILEFDTDATDAWPTEQKIRFHNPDGTFTREMKNSQGSWRIDDNAKGIFFKGNLKSGEEVQLKINVVDYSTQTPSPLTPRGFYVNHSIMRMPENTYKTAFTKTAGLDLYEWLPKGTIIGKVTWNNPPNEKLTVFESSLDGMLAVKPNGDVVVKADYLAKPQKIRKVYKDEVESYKEKTLDFIFLIKSDVWGESEGKHSIPVETKTLSAYNIKLKYPGNTVKTAIDYKTLTIDADSKLTKGMSIGNLGINMTDYTVEMAKLTTTVGDNSKLFTINAAGDLIYNSDNPLDVSSFYSVYLLVTKKATKERNVFSYTFSVNQLVKLPEVSSEKGQDFNKLVKSSGTAPADGFVTQFGELKNYIKIPNVLTEGVEVESSKGATKWDQYIGGTSSRFAKKAENTLPKRPFMNLANPYIPPNTQFTTGVVSKTFNDEQTFTYKFKAAVKDGKKVYNPESIKNIVLFSVLPRGNINYGPFREFDDTGGKRAGFNSTWAGTWTVAEWKKYLVISYLDSTGAEVKIDPSEYLITRIQEVRETDTTKGGDGETQYLQRISITLPTAVTTNTIKVTLKPLPVNDDPKYQKAHAFSKILFGT